MCQFITFSKNFLKLWIIKLKINEDFLQCKINSTNFIPQKMKTLLFSPISHLKKDVGNAKLEKGGINMGF